MLLLAASISVLWGAIYLLLLAASISDFLRRDIFAVIHSFNQRLAPLPPWVRGRRAGDLDLGRLSVRDSGGRFWREWLCAPLESALPHLHFASLFQRADGSGASALACGCVGGVGPVITVRGQL